LQNIGGQNHPKAGVAQPPVWPEFLSIFGWNLTEVLSLFLFIIEELSMIQNETKGAKKKKKNC
jgi:hypothetical protein